MADNEQTPPDNSDELDRLRESQDESEAQVHGPPSPEEDEAPETRAVTTSAPERPDFKRIFGGARVPYPVTAEEARRPAHEPA